jgi:serine/threonine protein kinase
VQPGDTISDRYRLLRLIDVGGMGEVWAARNELTHRNFAIKFLLPSLTSRPDALERFIREAETAGRLQHPSIVDVYDVAQTECGRPFIVMELLTGETLESRLEREGRLSDLRASAFMAQIAQALELAHDAGVVHRDLSSANIFLARNPEGGEPIPKILDFGVSKTVGPAAQDRTVTGNGAILGCPEYMSPEQARGAETVDSRTDIWTIGVVLYQCLTGTVPFCAGNYNAMMVSILTRLHRPLLEVAPWVDPELALVVERCLIKDREQRIQTAHELAVRLGVFAHRLAGELSVAGVAPRRRATDRIDREDDRFGQPEASAVALPPHRHVARWLLSLRPRRTSVALVSAAFGAAIGALGTHWTLSSTDGTTSKSEAPAPGRVLANDEWTTEEEDPGRHTGQSLEPLDDGARVTWRNPTRR